jgi:hypothetical protein
MSGNSLSFTASKLDCGGDLNSRNVIVLDVNSLIDMFYKFFSLSSSSNPLQIIANTVISDSYLAIWHNCPVHFFGDL